MHRFGTRPCFIFFTLASPCTNDYCEMHHYNKCVSASKYSLNLGFRWLLLNFRFFIFSAKLKKKNSKCRRPAVDFHSNKITLQELKTQKAHYVFRSGHDLPCFTWQVIQKQNKEDCPANRLYNLLVLEVSTGTNKLKYSMLKLDSITVL